MKFKFFFFKFKSKEIFFRNLEKIKFQINFLRKKQLAIYKQFL